MAVTSAPQRVVLAKAHWHRNQARKRDNKEASHDLLILVLDMNLLPKSGFGIARLERRTSSFHKLTVMLSHYATRKRAGRVSPAPSHELHWNSILP